MLLTPSRRRQVSEAHEREAEALQKVDSLELELRAERAGRQALNSSLVEAAQGEGEREAAFAEQKKILLQVS